MIKLWQAVLLTIISFLLGVMITIFAYPKFIENKGQTYHGNENLKEMRENLEPDSDFDDDFSASNDPFEQMQRMREKMLKQFKDFEEDSFMGMGGSMTFDSLEVNQYEKGENWVVDVSLNDKEIKDLKVNIENDQLTLSGSMEKKLNDSEDQNGGFFSNGIVSQSFTRQFPLPSGLNSEKMEMKTENGHLLIIIPKS